MVVKIVFKKKVYTKLNTDEEQEINRYIQIYIENNFKEPFEVNKYISFNNMWDLFPNIRSLNDHTNNKTIPGILPNFYAIVCKKLDIKGTGGSVLDKAEHY